MMCTEERIQVATEAMRKELYRATTLFPPFHSAHEGYAVIFEELCELWEEIKARKQSVDAMRREAIQVAAMATRFVVDLTFEDS